MWTLAGNPHSSAQILSPLHAKWRVQLAKGHPQTQKTHKRTALSGRLPLSSPPNRSALLGNHGTGAASQPHSADICFPLAVAIGSKE